MGQPAFALPASSSNLAASIPGIFAFSTRCDAVTVHPAGGTLSRLTSAVTSMRSGVKPASPSVAESAIAKQPECAAAISSSGFVPAPDSKREPKEYSVFLSAPPGAVIAPLPVLSEPCQTAEAERFMGSVDNGLDALATVMAPAVRTVAQFRTCATRSVCSPVHQSKRSRPINHGVK